MDKPMTTVTCTIGGGLLKVEVIGKYDFEEVKRTISAALDQSSAHAIVYDMRLAVSPSSAAEVRKRAAWIGGLRDQGLRVCAVVVAPDSRVSGIAVLEEMGMPVQFFNTVALAEDWASTQIRTVVDHDDTGTKDTHPSR
jgi:hypothetical protein